MESYLRAVGIGSSQNREAFREALRETHGRIADAVADAVAAREEGGDVDIYVLKNTTLALSIDVTSQYCSQMYEQFLAWFLRARFPTPKSVLDVGCDNGILTCFYATVFPEAEVVGVDKCEQGIRCARELSGRLNLANVRFEVRDLLNLEGVFPDQSFDLIVSTTVFHEVLGVPADVPGRSIEAITIGPDNLDSVKIVTDLVRMLRGETGRWLSMERWLDASSLAWWIRLINEAGLSMIADQSTLLQFCSWEGEQETLPILIATRHRHPSVGSGEHMLAFRMYGSIAENEEQYIVSEGPRRTRDDGT
ncbi:MAG: class I SAM-dependent methyltransferase [Candidatus Methylomirabilales bacterium]